MKKYYVSPSLMCVDLLDLRRQISFLDKHADFFHVDIMDGHFVPNLTLSSMIIEQISPLVTTPIDAHLMVTRPQDFIDQMIAAGAKWISPHAETINANAFRTLRYIKDKGAHVGLALNPSTPLSYCELYLDMVEKITIMTVDPGFAGQKFVPQVLEKIKQADQLRKEKGYHYLIEIDGSCNKTTFAQLKQAGADVFIAGSGLFNPINRDKVPMEQAWDAYVRDIENA